MIQPLWRIACYAIALLFCATLATADEDGREREDLVVFGDSLSDPGNFYAAFHASAAAPYAPIPSAPYAIGGFHFSNGATWIEQLGHALRSGNDTGPALSRARGAANYAVGGARARANADAMPYDLTLQVSTYLADRRTRADRRHALHVLWIGGNDLRDALESLFTDSSGATAQSIITQAVGTTAANIQSLWAAGARRFLIVDVPNVGITPAVRSLGPQAQILATQLTAAYNSGLHAALAQLSLLPRIDIQHFDVNAAINAALAYPDEAGFSNTVSTCLTFGVVAGAVCERPREYLFWDAIHPTRAGHRVIAEAALESLASSESQNDD